MPGSCEESVNGMIEIQKGNDNFKKIYYYQNCEIQILEHKSACMATYLFKNGRLSTALVLTISKSASDFAKSNFEIFNPKNSRNCDLSKSFDESPCGSILRGPGPDHISLGYEGAFYKDNIYGLVESVDPENPGKGIDNMVPLTSTEIEQSISLSKIFYKLIK
jgi:hypothetical protein